MSKKNLYRGGVIPYYIDKQEIKMMFMMPSVAKYGGKTFQIAKGKQDPGETLFVTAMREGQEELGLFRGNVEQVHLLGTFLGRTEVYIAEVKDPSPTMFGDPTEETEEVAWMTPEQFNQEGRELHRPVIKAATRMIKKIHDLD